MSSILRPAFSLIVTFITVAGVGGAWFALQPRIQGEVTVPVPQPQPSGATIPKGSPIGSTGCLAAACHGGSATDALAGKLDANTWQSSGTCWTAADPHTRAYSLLTDKPLKPVRVTADQIMKQLRMGIPATEDVRCLACHSNPALPMPPTEQRVLARRKEMANCAACHRTTQPWLLENAFCTALAAPALVDPQLLALRQEGVSCEACHGNASGWLREHTTWNGDRKELYAKVGMTPLFDIGERAMTCLGCHVGAPADPARGYPVRDMNHDMIAAGHPRLNFDFAEYQRQLPKHWQEKERTATGPKPRSAAFEAKVWLVGRVAHAEAACRLLADRADRAKSNDPRTPWPEFAEYNCASCHHDIPENWRSEGATLATRVPGALRWQTIWPVTESFHPSAVEPVVSIMQKKRLSGFGEVGPRAHQSAKNLMELRQKLLAEADADVEKLKLSFTLGPGFGPDWDDLGQRLQGLSALQRAGLIQRPIAGVDRAFDAVRGHNWDAAKPLLIELLGRW